MDDRVWRLAIGSLVAAVLGMVLNAVLGSDAVPTGFWAFESALLGFLGAVLAYLSRNGRNGNRER